MSKKRVLIIGTGLECSILAGALSRSEEHNVVQIDCSATYGATEFPMLTLEELMAMPAAINTIYLGRNSINLENDINEEAQSSSPRDSTVKQEFLNRLILKFSKRYMFELNSRVIYSSGPLVDLLVQSGVGEGILEFQLVKEVLHAKTIGIFDQASESINPSLSSAAASFQISPAERVPSSKEDIFVNDQISLRDKRVLMQFFTSCIHGSDSGGDVDEKFVEFVAKSKIPSNLQEVIVKCLTLTLANDDIKNMSKEAGVKMINMYLSSIGRFGNGALLTAMYGTGSELCQAFSRYAAVYGATSALDCKILDIVADTLPESGSSIFSVQTSVETFQADIICVAADQLPHLSHLSGPFSSVKNPTFNQDAKKTYHLFLVSETHSLLSSSSHLIQLFTAGNDMNGVYCVQYNSECGMCPRDYYVLHLWTSGNGEAVLIEIEKELLRNCDERRETAVLSIRLSTSSVPTSLSSTFVTSAKGGNLYVLPSSSDRTQLIIESASQQAKEIFNAITANCSDFYPKKILLDEE